MDLVNKQVTHKAFGKGNIVDHNETHIKIQFPSGSKLFVFPDAFDSFLKLEDKEAAASVDEILQVKLKENRKKEKEIEKKKEEKFEEVKRIIKRETLLKNFKLHPESQAAFWIKDNDEHDIFEDWRAMAGFIKSGKNKGKPNRPIRLQANSACLLTRRESEQSEKDREIIGVYMVDEDFIGKLCDDGFIPAHPDYRFKLTKEESAKMPFWKYYINNRNPEKMTWNSGVYRYFSNDIMAQIIKDLVALKQGTDQQEIVEEFFARFCDINKINANAISKPNGPLVTNDAEEE